ncbi:MAG: hypothetical protein PVJ52_03015 [Candidatus Woesebacteria bacterium]|jgi:hypothetical protein
MDKKDYQELLQRRKEITKRILKVKKNLDHPHGQWQSAHDLAESEYKVLVAHLEAIEKEIESF